MQEPKPFRSTIDFEFETKLETIWVSYERPEHFIGTWVSVYPFKYR